MILLYLEDRPGPAIRALDVATRLAGKEKSRARALLTYAAGMRDGQQLLELRRYEEALRRFQACARVSIELADERKQRAARGNAGIVLVESGKPEEAGAVFARLAQEDPANPVWYWYLGRTLASRSRFADAAGAFARATALADRGSVTPAQRAFLRDAPYRWATSLLAAAKTQSAAGTRAEAWTQARAALERYVDAVPDSLPGRFVLGRLLFEKLDAPYEAVRHLERAHAIDPACDGALRLLVRIASRHGPPPNAEGKTTPEAQRAWDATRAGWEEELERGADEWERERARRREESGTGSDGCP